MLYYRRAILADRFRWLPCVQTILLIDPESQTVRSITRTGPHNWTDDLYGAGEDIAAPGLEIVLSHAEIFAR